jgi:hypothetical protein
MIITKFSNKPTNNLMGSHFQYNLKTIKKDYYSIFPHQILPAHTETPDKRVWLMFHFLQETEDVFR